MFEESLVIKDVEFNKIAQFIKANYGINLGYEKKSLVLSRLQNVLQHSNFKNFTDYFDYVVNDFTGSAIETLIAKISTNHTFFMRENEHFEYLKNNVLPEIVKNNFDKDIRIWSAGCSSGEEPYTIAMIISDFFGFENDKWNAKILATDISKAMIEKAVKAEYSEDQLEAIPTRWKKLYFKKMSDFKFTLQDRIKDEIIYRSFNLMEEKFPFKKRFHIIFCRNVMIYFDLKTKTDLVRKFYEFTEPGGYLFVGHSETLNRDETKYKYVMPAVFRK